MKYYPKISVFLLIIPLYILTSIQGIVMISNQVVKAENLKLPNIAKVKSMSNGDTACYVNLVDSQGRKYENIYADFEICSQEKSLLNKKVKVFWRKVKFNNCESVEPCGKSIVKTAITKMEIIK